MGCLPSIELRRGRLRSLSVACMECMPLILITEFNGRVLKANFSFCQLIASLSFVLPQLNLTKIKLEYLKFGLEFKKKLKHSRKIYCLTRVRLFLSSARVIF